MTIINTIVVIIMPPPTHQPQYPRVRLSHQTPESRQVGMAGVGGILSPCPSHLPHPSSFLPSLQGRRPPGKSPSPPRGSSGARCLTSWEMAPPAGTWERGSVGPSNRGEGGGKDPTLFGGRGSCAGPQHHTAYWMEW